MFKALVIACAISNPQMCITFEDAISKLDTEQQCIERAYQMRKDIAEELEDMKAVAYKCIQLKKGKFT
jgi:3-oxoacyl-[acyl-carrier-protein] synthase III